ncbi:MAG: MoaD/ThiS family protein [Candidatus Thorarchaeota archaeon]
MQVRFKPLGTLRRKMGKSEVILKLDEGATVGDALDKVLEESDAEVRNLVKNEGKIRGNLILMLNKTSMSSIQGESTKLSDGDEIVLLPHIQGGGGDYSWM